MTCDRCGEARGSGYKFCPYCGTSFTEEIPMVPPEVPMRKARDRRNIRELLFGIGLLITVLLSVLLIFEVFVAVTGIGIVTDGLTDNGYEHNVILITPYIVNLFSLSGTALVVFYVIILAAAILSVILLFSKSVRPFMAIGKDKGESARKTALYEMTILFAVMLAIEIVYINMVGANNSAIDKTPVWKNMFTLLNASVWEEVITRFLIIGVPVAIFYAVLRKDKKEIRKALGGFDSFSPLVMFLIILSSVIFAAAHITSGSWGMWKLFPTFFFGIIAGYLFVKYGLYATIAMHFLNDYLNSETWFTGISMMPFTNCVLVITCIASIPFIYVYGKRIVSFFRNGMDKI